MWTVLAFVSALCLGFYDISKKIALRENRVVDVLTISVCVSSLFLSIPLIFSLCALSGRYSTCLYHPQINHCTQQLVLRIYLTQAPAYFCGKPYASYPSYVDVSRCVAPIQ